MERARRPWISRRDTRVRKKDAEVANRTSSGIVPRANNDPIVTAEKGAANAAHDAAGEDAGAANETREEAAGTTEGDATRETRGAASNASNRLIAKTWRSTTTQRFWTSPKFQRRRVRAVPRKHPKLRIARGGAGVAEDGAGAAIGREDHHDLVSAAMRIAPRPANWIRASAVTRCFASRLIRISPWKKGVKRVKGTKNDVLVGGGAHAVGAAAVARTAGAREPAKMARRPNLQNAIGMAIVLRPRARGKTTTSMTFPRMKISNGRAIAEFPVGMRPWR